MACDAPPSTDAPARWAPLPGTHRRPDPRSSHRESHGGARRTTPAGLSSAKSVPLPPASLRGFLPGLSVQSWVTAHRWPPAPRTGARTSLFFATCRDAAQAPSSVRRGRPQLALMRHLLLCPVSWFLKIKTPTWRRWVRDTVSRAGCGWPHCGDNVCAAGARPDVLKASECLPGVTCTYGETATELRFVLVCNGVLVRAVSHLQESGRAVERVPTGRSAPHPRALSLRLYCGGSFVVPAEQCGCVTVV